MDKKSNSLVKNARKCENINDPIDTYVVDYAAMAFSKMFIKLHIIPNVITLLSGIVGVAGGILLAFNSLLLTIIGILLIILSAIFDASDGQVARLTKHYSNFGRTLDGFADFCVYFSIYIALCVRLFGANIPFTDTAWSFWIIPFAALALWCFGAQARTLDYFKNVHMFMIRNGGGKHNELSKTADIKAQRENCKKFSLEHFRLTMYLSYTKLQEKATPKTQKLLGEIAKNGDEVPQPIIDAYKEKSKKYITLANALAFNLRTIVLFILLLLPWNVEAVYFAFVIVALEPIRIIVIKKYEKLAESVNKQEFFAVAEKEKKTA